MTDVLALPAPTDGSYSLRDMLWCGLCDRQMVPVWIADSEWERYYICSNATCLRLPVAAEVVENLVWFEYAQLYLLPNTWDIPRLERGPRLAEALELVTLGLESFERTYRWRDQ
jgi:hypothetical protein